MSHPSNISRPEWGLLRPRLGVSDDQNEALRIERVISIARVLLTAIALIQLNFDPIEPAAYAPLAHVLFVLFAGHSISALIVLRLRQRATRGFALTTHTIDLLAAAVTLPLASPGNSFFAFFLFVLAEAAFRWGFRETVATTAAAITLVIVHAEFAPALPAYLMPPLVPSSVDQVAIRSAYLAMMGLLLGYMAEESRGLRAESTAIATLLGKIRVASGLAHSATAVAAETAALFNASRLVLAAEDRSERLFRWDTAHGWSVAPRSSTGEPARSDRATYLFASDTHTLCATRRLWSRHTYRIVTLGSNGSVVEGGPTKLPDEFVRSHPCRRFISVPVAFGDDWSGRLFLFDPDVDGRLPALGQFLRSIVHRVTPALFSVYVLNQLQARATATERARVARELHDGVIQSLISVDLQLEALQRDERLQTARLDMARLQQIVKNEVLNLRELMQQMRPPELNPDELLDYLADAVQRFGRDTGISARFSTDLRDVSLPQRVCFELVRIVQEALVNIRKHSAATVAVVRFGARDGAWRLEIDDNGRGFPFEGRRSQADLDAARLGPAVIKERVRAIGGELVISSIPGRGARLEVSVPQVAHG